MQQWENYFKKILKGLLLFVLILVVGTTILTFSVDHFMGLICGLVFISYIVYRVLGLGRFADMAIKMIIGKK